MSNPDKQNLRKNIRAINFVSSINRGVIVAGTNDGFVKFFDANILNQDNREDQVTEKLINLITNDIDESITTVIEVSDSKVRKES